MANAKEAYNKAIYQFAPHSGKVKDEDKNAVAVLAGLIYIGDSISEVLKAPTVEKNEAREVESEELRKFWREQLAYLEKAPFAYLEKAP